MPYRLLERELMAINAALVRIERQLYVPPTSTFTFPLMWSGFDFTTMAIHVYLLGFSGLVYDCLTQTKVQSEAKSVPEIIAEPVEIVSKSESDNYDFAEM